MSTSDFLSETLEHWRYIRQGLISEVDNIPEGKFDFRPSNDVKSVHELVQHILEGSMMMVGELGREQPDFQRMSPPELLEEYAARAHEAKGKTALIGLLEKQFEEGFATFTKMDADAMMSPVTNFDGSQWSRMQWFFHGMTEEMYHRGQVVTYARLLGLVPALTQRIRTAEDA
jgi:uncharacterized damage-inducible protein DinB